jgi:hypothetical protein
MSASSRVVAVSRIISAARSHRRTCRNGSRSRIRIAASTRVTRWNAAARRSGAAATQASSSGCYCSFDGARPCAPARNTFRKKAGHEHMAKSGRLKLSQHLRQIRADRAAWISVAARPLAGAIGVAPRAATAPTFRPRLRTDNGRGRPRAVRGTTLPRGNYKADWRPVLRGHTDEVPP